MSRRIALFAAVGSGLLILAAGTSAFLWWHAGKGPRREGSAVHQTAAPERLALEIVSPRGALSEVPDHLAWRAVPDAAIYSVEIWSPNTGLIVGFETLDTRHALPVPVGSGLRAGARFRWRVVALAARGFELAKSEDVEFFLSASAPSPQG